MASQLLAYRAAMRVAVLGGTVFIGRAVVEELHRRGHELLVVHRGTHEPADGFPDVEHLHADRAQLGDHVGRLASFAAEAVVDTRALSRADVSAVLDALPGEPQLVVLSSCDVYRALGALSAGTVVDTVPLDEESPVREERFPYRGVIPGMDDYEKLDCEELYLARGGVVLRLPFVVGPRDYQRREEWMLRRVRLGRERMPFGAGSFLGSRVAATDVATAVAAVLEGSVTDEVFVLAERRCPTVRQLAEEILAAAGHTMELVRVPDDALPDDLGLTAAPSQHLLLSADKARRVLGWEPAPWAETVRRSVAWHLDHPPAGDDPGFDADDAALASVG